jgi:hypothetical protein
MNVLQSDLRLQAPDDIYEAVLSLGDGLSDTAAHAALAAFAWLLANHVGDDRIVLEAVAQAKQAFAEYPEAALVGTGRQEGKPYHVGGALASLRRIIDVKPAPTLPGALTS